MARSRLAVRRRSWTYSVTGAEEVAVELRQAGGRCTDLREPFQKLGREYRKQVGRQFDTGGATFGSKPWEPLKPATIKRKRRNKTRPLIETGALKRSYTNQRDPGNISEVGPQRASFGSRHRNRRGAPTAKFHQYGYSPPNTLEGRSRTPFPNRRSWEEIVRNTTGFHAPARPAILANVSLRQFARDEIVDHILEPVRRPGGARVVNR